MKEILILYLLLINAVAFLLMLIDKWKAKKNLWRISEATLMSTAILGGGIGALLVVGGVGVLMSTKKKKGNT